MLEERPPVVVRGMGSVARASGKSSSSLLSSSSSSASSSSPSLTGRKALSPASGFAVLTSIIIPGAGLTPLVYLRDCWRLVGRMVGCWFGEEAELETEFDFI